MTFERDNFNKKTQYVFYCPLLIKVPKIVVIIIVVVVLVVVIVVVILLMIVVDSR